MSVPRPSQNAGQVVQHAPRELFSPQNPSSSGSAPQLPPLRVPSSVLPLPVLKPRIPSATPALTSCPPCAGPVLRPPGRPSTPAPPHPGGSRASGRGGVSPAGSRRVPDGPRAAGKRDPGSARSGARAAAAAAPAGARGGRTVGGAEPPWPPQHCGGARGLGLGAQRPNARAFPRLSSLQSAGFVRFRLPPRRRGGPRRGAGLRAGRTPSAGPSRATRRRCAPSPRSSPRPRQHRPLRADVQLGPLQPIARVIPLLPQPEEGSGFVFFPLCCRPTSDFSALTSGPNLSLKKVRLLSPCPSLLLLPL